MHEAIARAVPTVKERTRQDDGTAPEEQAKTKSDDVAVCLSVGIRLIGASGEFATREMRPRLFLW